MQHIQMTEESIRQLTGDRFYKRGYSYYKNGKVYGLSYNPENHSWRGLVKGTKIYTVRIYFTNEMMIDTTCNCPAFATHDTCKHVAAVLLAITQDAQSNRKRFAVDRNAQQVSVQDTDLFAKQLLYTFRDKSQHTESPQVVETEYMLTLTKASKNTQYALTIEVKMGDKRPYVIRDIRGFLKALNSGESFKINQSFTFYPSVHYFTSKDQHMIEMLLTCYEQERLFGNSYVLKLEQPRSIYIPPSLIDQLLDQLVEMNYIFKQESQKEYPSISVSEMTDQIHFQLDYQQQKSYTLEMTDLSDYYFLDSYRYVIHNNHFYKINYQQKQILEKLFRIMPFQNKKKQYISPSEMDVFVKNVMPQFEQVGSLEMSERMAKQINTDPLQIKVFIDEIDGSLKAEVEYHYGDTMFTPHSPIMEQVKKS
ncbi:DNA/RNA helicases [Gracilibacillus boraciitolerans JCM 21714]|uniref:DNA/RNA helicases n=1 Tax=Gracilibacillus boraciitolerans JCM 21714 TaxID=1298598 RepID=W4VJ03_9BACI|nr:SNF2 helicase associated domain-containing protein [Gracilibacillus boraciitolerans]GAE92739.1 DNA/RNA helicases [Gracilibacillus boraciitolerans JCM 21714]